MSAGNDAPRYEPEAASGADGSGGRAVEPSAARDVDAETAGNDAENRSVKSVNRSVNSPSNDGLNTTVNTTGWGTAVEAKNTGKRVEIRFNRRKKAERYFYWVWRWQSKDADGNPIKRESGTYVSRYEYGGKIDGATNSYVNERIEEYKKRKDAET